MKTRKSVKMIVAIDPNNGIGYQNDVLFRGDLPHFKSYTMGHTIVMGRKTYDGIGKPLPGRKNIVISKTKVDHPEVTTLTIDELDSYVTNNVDETIFICGGAKLYEYAAKMYDVDEIRLTQFTMIAENVDTYLPKNVSDMLDNNLSANSIDVVNEEKGFFIMSFIHVVNEEKIYTYEGAATID